MSDLSLEVIGRLFIILVVISVVLSIIIGLEADVLGFFDQIDDGDPAGEGLVEAESGEDIANLVEICYSENSASFQDEDCFMIRHPTESFDLSSSAIDNHIGLDDENYEFAESQYNRELIVLRYDFDQDSVVVED